MTMRLAAVVPASNQGPYLRATLESLLEQTVPFDEIVVSDNRSTDETGSILAEYSDALRTVQPPSHLPMSEHWNFAFAAADADYAVLLSSDDLAAPRMSEVFRRGIARRLDAVYIRGAYDIVDGLGRRTARRYLLSARSTTRSPWTVLEQLEGPKAVLCAGAVRLDAWRAVGGFPTNVSLLGDWGLWLRLACRGSFGYEPHVVASYRSGHQSEITAGRVLQYVRDMVVVDGSLIPDAARAVGLRAEDPRLRRASERRLLRLLAWLAVTASAGDRPVAVAELEPWAGRLGRLADLHRFERGAAPVAPERPRVLRRLVVPPLRAAYTWWRG